MPKLIALLIAVISLAIWLSWYSWEHPKDPKVYEKAAHAYLEKKYGEKFVLYAHLTGYSKWTNEGQSMGFYPVNGDPEKDRFDLSDGSRSNMADNYYWIILKNEMEEIVSKAFAEQFDSFKVHARNNYFTVGHPLDNCLTREVKISDLKRLKPPQLTDRNTEVMVFIEYEGLPNEVLMSRIVAAENRLTQWFDADIPIRVRVIRTNNFNRSFDEINKELYNPSKDTTTSVKLDEEGRITYTLELGTH